MALARRWKGRPRGLAELPAEIRTHPAYAEDAWLDRADQSTDGSWYRLRFDDGTVHYWFLNPVTDQYELSPVAPKFKYNEAAAPVPTWPVAVHQSPQAALPEAVEHGPAVVLNQDVDPAE